jgi:isoleucyl-tRNA synthetase
VPDEQLSGLDRWILAEYAKLEGLVLQAYDACEFHVVYQKVSQFAAVELSAIYHDVVKDRLYTDPAGSPRRRSTQTTLYRLVNGLLRMLAPLLAFTTDEAWEHVPDHNLESVHLLEWVPITFSLSSEESTLWNILFQLREQALPELERMRQDKAIGKALQAHLVLAGPEEVLGPVLNHQETLRELLNVSQLTLKSEGASGTPVVVTGSHADGQKCERCWHWETDIGAHTDHPTICGRCVQAVQS